MWTSTQPCNDTQRVNWAKVAELLKDLRASAGQTNASAFAEEIEVDKSTVGRIERAEVKPNLETIEKWVNACDGKLSSFFLHVESVSQIQTGKVGVSPAGVRALPDGILAEVSKLGSRTLRQMGQIVWALAGEAEKNERLSATVRGTGGDKPGKRR